MSEPTDTELLNWLQEQSVGSVTPARGWRCRGVILSSDGERVIAAPSVDIGYDYSSGINPSPDVRHAIAAAMAMENQRKGGT